MSDITSGHNENKLSIKRATPKDADAISHVIVQTLRKTNAKDYSSTIIDNVVSNFSVEKVLSQINNRQVFVALLQGKIVGTASLEGEKVRSVFVLPERQKQNIGTSLMNHIEEVAKIQNISSLMVSSSITAEAFYKKLGYLAVRNEYYGEERTIIMEKKLKKA